MNKLTAERKRDIAAIARKKEMPAGCPFKPVVGLSGWVPQSPALSLSHGLAFESWISTAARKPSFAPVHNNMQFLHIEAAMRTNIEIDDKLMIQAMRSIGANTKKAAVEAALRLLVDTHRQSSIRQFKGKIQWEGNLDQSRLGRATE